MPRILIGRGGADRPFRLLADGLRKEGYQVDETAGSPVGAHSTGKAAQDVLNKIDMAFLVVSESDAADNGGPVKPFQRVVREAGVMQGKLGMDRVVLLVEESVEGLSADTGVGHIRFPAGMPEAVLNDVLASIRFAFPPQQRDLRAQVPIREQARDEALKVPWLLVAAVFLVAIIPLTLAIRALIGGSQSDDVSRQQMNGVASALAVGASQAATAPDTDQTTAETTAAPQGPSLPSDEKNLLFPATCRLDLTAANLSGSAVDCGGAGTVIVDGYPGPWHKEVGQVAVGEGVVGELTFEPRANGTTSGPSVVELLPGTITLNEADATFGVSTITLRFSANDQHIHLLQADSRGGQGVTLTFSLDP